MSVLSPSAKLQFTDITGAPLVGGFLYTYAAGTTTPLATYTDSSGTSLNSNPVVLNARGEANVWLGGSLYKFKLTDSNNNEIWTVDNISAPTSALSPVLSGNVVINSDSSNPALLITQTGTGAILRAQDSTNPDLTPFIIDSDGRVGIGTTAPQASIDIANNGAFILSNGGTTWTVLSANASTSYFAAIGAGRDLVLETDNTPRVTISDTLVTSTNPVVLPGLPTTALQAATKSYVDQVMPSGMIMPFGGSAAPTGWLACQGQVVSQSTYANLYAAIGAAWNIGGEGAGNFRLPDLRGMFLRGTGTNATGSSSGAAGPAVGAYAADTYLNHIHSITDPTHSHDLPVVVGINGGGSGAVPYPAGGGTTFGTTASATGINQTNTSTTGGTETKPKNYGVLYIIKT